MLGSFSLPAGYDFLGFYLSSLIRIVFSNTVAAQPRLRPVDDWVRERPTEDPLGLLADFSVAF